ncbi:MAG: sugar ABC transporter permease YjfF, partial [Catenulispora sp.]|nr:sugar ABC transporter permease YjfF [Catenulispora sp.]
MTTLSASPAMSAAVRFLRDRRLPVLVTLALFLVMYFWGSYRY